LRHDGRASARAALHDCKQRHLVPRRRTATPDDAPQHHSLPMLACAIICDARATDVRTAVQAGRSSSALHRHWAHRCHICTGTGRRTALQAGSSSSARRVRKTFSSAITVNVLTVQHATETCHANTSRRRFRSGSIARLADTAPEGTDGPGAGGSSRLVSTSDAVQRTRSVQSATYSALHAMNEQRTTWLGPQRVPQDRTGERRCTARTAVAPGTISTNEPFGGLLKLRSDSTFPQSLRGSACSHAVCLHCAASHRSSTRFASSCVLMRTSTTRVMRIRREASSAWHAMARSAWATSSEDSATRSPK
jgi:hypothetical protein